MRVAFFWGVFFVVFVFVCLFVWVCFVFFFCFFCQAAVSNKISNLLICFCSFYYSCHIPEKDNFIEIWSFIVFY